MKQSFDPYFGGPIFITSDSLLNGFNVLFEDTFREYELRQIGELRKNMETYMDSTSLPLFNEMDKLPSPVASPKSDKTRPNVGKPVQVEFELPNPKLLDFRVETEPLAMAVPSWENHKVAEREGFEPTCRTGAKSLENTNLVEC